MEALNENNFKLHLRDKHAFPRGGLRLYPALNRRGDASVIPDMETLQKFTLLKKDVFINLFSEDQKRSKVYDCIFLDIDHKDEQVAFNTMEDICSLLAKAEVKHWYVIFSGSKGYHIYIPFKPILLSDYSRAVRTWLHKLGILSKIDTHCIEPNRVTRVVGSINTKSGMYCVYVGDGQGTQFFDLDEIKYIAGLGGGMDLPDIQYNDLSILREYDRITVKYDNSDTMTTKSKTFSKVQHYPECMLKLYNEALNGTDLGHIERLELGKFMLHVKGGDVNFVKKLFMGMTDYSEKTTVYQLEYIKNRKLNMMNCDKMMHAGLCPFENQQEANMNCPFYPSLHKHIRNEVDVESS